MRSGCCLCVCVYVCVCVCPLSLPGNGSVKIPLSMLGNGSVKNPPNIARQRFGKNAVTNTQATIEELLETYTGA
jgi:hypothetical protein